MEELVVPKDNFYTILANGEYKRDPNFIAVEAYIDRAFVDEEMRRAVEGAVIGSLVLSATYAFSPYMDKYIQLDSDIFLSFWRTSDNTMRIAIEGSWSKKCNLKSDPDIVMNLFKMFCINGAHEYVGLAIGLNLDTRILSFLTIKRIILSMKTRERSTSYMLDGVGKVFATPITDGRIYLARHE